MRMNLLIRTVTVLSLTTFTALACRADTIYGLPITAILSTTDPNTTMRIGLNPSPTQIIEPGVEFRFDEIYLLIQHYSVFEESFWTVDFGPDSISVTIGGGGGPNSLLTLSGLPPSFGNLQTPYPTNCTLSVAACNSYAPLATFSGSTLSIDFPSLPANETYLFTPLSASATPEPSSLTLLATGALGLAAALRRRFPRI